jgi:hypothetical protein
MVAGAPDVHTKHMNEYTVWEENIPTVTLGGKYEYGKCYTFKVVNDSDHEPTTNCRIVIIWSSFMR